MPADILATFELDSAGSPRFFEVNDLRHYAIRLSIASPTPETYAVTYLLHETFYDPVRESTDRGSCFAQEFTSYGDFTIQAKIRSRTGVETVAASLSRALTNGHTANLNASIASAIADIRAH